MRITRVLVANRGEIAVRVIRACHALGLEAVLAVSQADRDSLPARMADRVVCIGPPPASASYLRPENVVAAALGTGSQAVHPGYGFLAEDPRLADACTRCGLIFIGPRAEHIRLMGNKLEARAMARRLGVPTVPGSEQVRGFEEALRIAETIGFPLIIKAAAGGGGRGIKLVIDPRQLQPALQAAAAEARSAFGDDTLYLERYIPNARHVEVQVMGDRYGRVVHLGERDCSVQRRHQKVVEEAPAYALPEDLRQKIREAAVVLAREMGYENAGTVEFIVDQDSEQFYFLEMNTRIQVEHPVTEAITGVDLVQTQIRVAAGDPLPWSQSDIHFQGHAIEFRITAESAQNGFRPCPGVITEWGPPTRDQVRVDTHCYPGYRVPPFYDSLLAKLIVSGKDRREAIERAQQALDDFRVAGIETTLPFLRDVVRSPDYVSGLVHTRWLEEFVARWPSDVSSAPSQASS